MTLVSCVVGAPARLEVAQLLDDVLKILAGDARDFVLPGKTAHVAHRAKGLVGLELAELGLLRVDLEVQRFGLLLGVEKSASSV